MKFLLLIFLFNLFNFSEIVIPFYSRLSEIPKSKTPFDFFNSLLTNEIYTKIKIGTPPQELDLEIDFENYNTYLFKEKNFGKNRYPRFNYNASSTFNYLGNEEYFSDSDFSFATNSSDIVTINDTLKNYNYTFLHGTIKNVAKEKYPGNIGFNSVQNGDNFHKESGLIYQLKLKKVIDNYLFTLSFNENDFNGNIIIGKNIYKDYPREKFFSDYCLITPIYDYFWGWSHLDVHLNSDLLDIKQVQIKPELGVVIINSSYKEIFKKLFREKINEEKCYDIYTGFYCDKDVDINIGELKFEMKRKGMQFSLDSKDLFMEYNDKLFFLIKFDARVLPDDAKLGYPFLKKYDMIFDIDSRNVGFYNFKIKYEYKKEKNEEKENKEENENNKNEENKKEEKTDKNNDDNKIIDGKNNINEKIKKNKNDENITKKVIFFLLLIFFVILIIYCVFTIFRRCERKRKGKIFEELFL